MGAGHRGLGGGGFWRIRGGWAWARAFASGYGDYVDHGFACVAVAGRGDWDDREYGAVVNVRDRRRCGKRLHVQVGRYVSRCLADVYTSLCSLYHPLEGKVVPPTHDIR